ncbi:hypothetical protein ACFL1B_02590 [Nanoarchaeota archaeon]
MSLPDKILKASAAASWDVAREVIGEQSERTDHANKVILALDSLDAFAGTLGDEWFVLGPTAGTTPFDQLVNAILYEAVGRFNPQETKYNGVTSYLVDSPPPKSLALNFGSIPIGVNLTRIGALDPEKMDLEMLSDYMPDQQAGDKFSIKLTKSAVKEKYISAAGESRKHFPGYRMNFGIHDKHVIWNTHFASASDGTRTGALAGHFFAKDMRFFYMKHIEAKPGTHVNFRVIKPGEIYKVVSVTPKP